MDKTGLQLDMPGGTTLETRHKKLWNQDNEKDRFTVVLCARADGLKLHPLVVSKGKRKDKSEKFMGIVIEMQENAWMTEELTLRWLRMVWGGVAATRERHVGLGCL